MTLGRPRFTLSFALALACAASLLASSAWSDTLAEVRARGALRWGADQEGGGPYVFPRDDRPSEVTGFEVDLAAKLAARLGVRAEFTQASWDKLPDMLRTSKIDVVLNGYELTPEREDVMTASLPYYAYALALMARRDDARVSSWDDLPHSKGAPFAIGVLTGSAAETYVKELCAAPGGACVVRSYDGNTDAMREVETGKLDATVQDTPIAAFYASRFPKLRTIGEPRRKGYYVMYTPKGDAAIARALDEAIVSITTSGELERIDRAYGIWDARQGEIVEIARASRFYGYAPQPAPANEKSAGAVDAAAPKADDSQRLGARKHGLDVVTTYGAVLLESAGLTALLAVLSFPLAAAIGLLVALGRLYGPRWLGAPLALYVEFLRGTPVMLQLYFVFFFLPEVGIDLPPLACGVVGLAVNYSAYESEIYRAGLQAVPPG
ncbi:MAG TPA: ABC transporter permease subunit, partial [Byssovorax sp.]